MGKSFQDQLLALGLVDKKKVNESKKQQHQKKKKSGKGKKVNIVDENALLAKEAEEKKKARARQLNKERDAKLQKRAETAQIKQYVEQNRIEKDEKGVAYRFNVSGKIQRIFVAKDIADQLSDGRLGIVVQGEQFEVVPRAIVEKIVKMDSKVTVILNDKPDDSDDPDDPYADYKVPDDLVW